MQLVRNNGRGPSTAVTFTVSEMETLAYCVASVEIRERLICAIRLHDSKIADEIAAFFE